MSRAHERKAVDCSMRQALPPAIEVQGYMTACPGFLDSFPVLCPATNDDVVCLLEYCLFFQHI